jgi:hypothetical protein
MCFHGDRQYQYDPFHYLLVTLELPRTSQITQASPEQPYLSFRLELDPHTVGRSWRKQGTRFRWIIPKWMPHMLAR